MHATSGTGRTPLATLQERQLAHSPVSPYPPVYVIVSCVSRKWRHANNPQVWLLNHGSFLRVVIVVHSFQYTCYRWRRSLQTPRRGRPRACPNIQNTKISCGGFRCSDNRQYSELPFWHHGAHTDYRVPRAPRPNIYATVCYQISIQSVRCYQFSDPSDFRTTYIVNARQRLRCTYLIFMEGLRVWTESFIFNDTVKWQTCLRVTQNKGCGWKIYRFQALDG